MGPRGGDALRGVVARSGWLPCLVLLGLAFATPRLPFEWLAGAATGLGVAAVMVVAGLWGASRFLTPSPLHRAGHPGYGAFLAATPWEPGDPLPMGPLRLEPVDAVPLLTLAGAVWLLGLPGLAPWAPVVALAAYAAAFTLAAWRVVPLTRVTAALLAALPWASASWWAAGPVLIALLVVQDVGVTRLLRVFGRREPPLPLAEDPGFERFLRSTLGGGVLAAAGPAPPWGPRAGWRRPWYRADAPWLPVLLTVIAVLGGIDALLRWGGEGVELRGTRDVARGSGGVLFTVMVCCDLFGRARPGEPPLVKLACLRPPGWESIRLWAQAAAVLAIGYAGITLVGSGPVEDTLGGLAVWCLVALAATQAPRLLRLGAEGWEKTGPRRVWTESLRTAAAQRAAASSKASAAARVGGDLVVGETFEPPVAPRPAA